MNSLIVQEEESVNMDVMDVSLLLCGLQKELERRKENNYNVELFYSSIRRPNCGVVNRESGKFISSTNDLVELITQLPSLQIERGYSGPDHRDVVVCRARLPKNYFGRVAYIKYKHIPRSFKNRRLIDTVSMPYRGPKKNGPEPEGEVVRVLRELQPVFTDRSLYEIPSQTIESEYNYITFKLTNERLLKGWFAGVDVNSIPCSSKEEEFVLIGRHYAKR